MSKSKYMEYGTYLKVFTGPGPDNEWFIGDDDVADYSTFEFEYLNNDEQL